jgi:aryl-alcohol dehydrogenase-like predicted oxidoreductase
MIETASATTAPVSTTRKRHVGVSDLNVFPIAISGTAFGWTADDAATDAILDAYVAQGGNFIDTADSYAAWVPGNTGGESEAAIGEWMARRGNRAELVLATKVSEHPGRRGLGAANVAAAAEDSLRRLGTDYIDLYYAHFDDAETPLAETVAAFDRLVREGKVRYVGISNYSPARIAEWFELAESGGHALPVALQPHYNLVAREPFETELRPLAERHELGVMPYYALAAGFLTGKYRAAEHAAGAPRSGMVAGYLNERGFAALAAVEEVAAETGAEMATVALAWLLAQPTVVAPIASARSVEQVGPLVAAARLELSPGQLARLGQSAS